MMMVSRLRRPPSDLPNLSGLRAVLPGWWLGEMLPGRLEPSHALALVLRRTELRWLSIFQRMGQKCAYLQGRPPRSPGQDGWLLVTLDGHALGWGMRVRGVVKNHYPRKLRWPTR
jgi:NOL1/NOP2/fmu family ribosome biogenesis protein